MQPDGSSPRKNPILRFCSKVVHLASRLAEPAPKSLKDVNAANRSLSAPPVQPTPATRSIERLDTCYTGAQNLYSCVEESPGPNPTVPSSLSLGSKPLSSPAACGVHVPNGAAARAEQPTHATPPEHVSLAAAVAQDKVSAATTSSPVDGWAQEGSVAGAYVASSGCGGDTGAPPAAVVPAVAFFVEDGLLSDSGGLPSGCHTDDAFGSEALVSIMSSGLVSAPGDRPAQLAALSLMVRPASAEASDLASFSNWAQNALPCAFGDQPQPPLPQAGPAGLAAARRAAAERKDGYLSGASSPKVGSFTSRMKGWSSAASSPPAVPPSAAPNPAAAAFAPIFTCGSAPKLARRGNSLHGADHLDAPPPVKLLHHRSVPKDYTCWL